MAAQWTRPIPKLARDLPTLPELSSEPDYRELAMAYGAVSVAYTQQWPALVDAIGRLERNDEIVLEELRKQRRKVQPAALVALIGLAAIVAVETFALFAGAH